MKIDIITIFPNFFNEFLNTSIVKRAIEKGSVAINIHNLRNYSDNKHKNVDDTPYGGGVGMVMSFPPFYKVINKLKTARTKIIMLTPQGRIFNQKTANKIAKEDEHLILLCGHYEGIDARVEQLVDLELSIGNYILTGGEIPAMIISDAIIRLLPGVITEESHKTDSLEDDRLKYPQYTKPESYEGFNVPEVLLTGHHKNIEDYRAAMQIIKTKTKRPDLIEKTPLSKAELEILKNIK